MPDVRESNLPKITNYSDIKELRLVKTDGSSVSMTVENFINAVAEKIARVDGFASVVAELITPLKHLGVITSGDCNSLTGPGTYYLSGEQTISNGPAQNLYGLLFSISSHAAVFQICSLYTLKAFYRIKWGNDWTSWTQL